MRIILPLLVFAYAAHALGTADLSRAKELQRAGKLDPAYTAFAGLAKASIAARDEPAAAQSLAGMAQIDLALGRYAACITEATGALERFRAQANSTEAARILLTRGQARFYAGDSTGALVDFEQSLVIVSSAGDREQEVNTLNNIGSIYFALGRYGDALGRYRNAENRLADSTDRQWYASRYQVTRANLAVLYQRIGQYRQALDIYRAMNAGGGALAGRERAQMLGNIGTLYRRLGDPVSALEQYRAAQQLFHQSALLAGEVGVLNNIGIAQTLDLHDPASAIRTFTEALHFAEKSGGKRLVMTSLLYRGEALLRSDNPASAQADFQTAALLSTELRAGEEQWRAEYGLARIADLQADIALSNTLLRTAIATIERLRKDTATPTGRSGFLIERSEVYDLLLQHETASAQPDNAAVYELMEQSRARELQDRAKTRLATLQSLQRELPPGSLLLEYWQSDTALAVLAISRSGARLIRRPLTPELLHSLRELPHALADPLRKDWLPLSQKAGVVLLADIDFTGVNRIVVSTDGDLARIPFEVLPVGNRMLIDRASVSYLPYASAFTRQTHERRYLAPWQTALLAFANPNAGTAPGLPRAETEVREAANAIGGRHELHLGADARKQYLARLSPHAPPLLHFATHAFADPEDADRSYILFAAPDRPATPDYLFLKEAAALPMKDVDLVTISACDSGTGQFRRGEGVQSFASAFLSAGARAAITSLWRAGDRSSEELMTRFYRGLADGQTASASLRDAKLAFRQSGNGSAHPAHWAGFVLTGDGETKGPGTFSWTLLCAVAVLLAAVAYLVWNRIRR